MQTNFARRAYDHQFRYDWIVRDLLDTDFYKLLMLQFIWRNFLFTQNTFKVINRTKTVRLADDIDIGELRAQLDHVRTLAWSNQAINYLKSQEFYGKRDLFSSGFLDYLTKSWKLGDYTLGEEVDETNCSPDHGGCAVTGQLSLTFHGTWAEVTMWEIYALTIVNEMRNRKLMADMSELDLDVMYSQAKTKLFKKLQRLSGSTAKIAEFGTRRRHGHLWQEYVIQMMMEHLGTNFVGTSNVFFAMKYGINAIGTNAHELPMTLAAMAKSDEELKESQYRVCQLWQDDYRGGLLVMLPDTFGTTQFLKNAPGWLADWTGARPDSKKAIPGGEELITYWEHHGQNPQEKLVIFSDGMDVRIDGFEPQGQDIIEVHDHFKGRIRDSYGWGTTASNDFLGCHPTDPDRMKAISLVCKVDSAEGRAAVKLSDNYLKATASDPLEVTRYRDVFGNEGMDHAPVRV
jgi:nicotinate phosphoribosyltransferase